MDINLRFLSYEKLQALCMKDLSGRLLSMNFGKNLCVGVIHLPQGYAMFNYTQTQQQTHPIKRGDVILFKASAAITGSKSVLQIREIIQHTLCMGTLPNKQFKGETDFHRILPVMFIPENSYLLKVKAATIRYLRQTLYSQNFDEINTPVLFNQKSPSDAACFSVETTDGKILYLKSIHEHLLKPYLLVGFDRIFEIGPVFRNIQYSHQFDCEFTNADIWIKNTTLSYLINLCINLAQGIRIIQDMPRLNVMCETYENFLKKKGLAGCSRNEIKRFIQENYKGALLILSHYPRGKKLYIQSTQDGFHNEEFHVFGNGVSFAHGYIVDTQAVTIKPMNTECCQIFEEYSVYGTESFGGVGIGIEKMLQAMLNVEDYHKLNLYRRKY